jgi:outer membrane receptor protein involved in Fe transport
MRGDLPFAKTWSWDLGGTYSAVDQDSSVEGYLFLPKLSPAFGPNFVDTDGVVKCGQPGAVIPNCTPINPFNLESPDSVAALGEVAAGYNQNYSYIQQNLGLHFTGDVFDLPAGAVKAAVGYEFMDQDGSFDTDFNTQAQPPTYNVCQLSNETCSGDSSGSYDVNSIYGELFIPVLKDLPGAQAVNLTAGVRYSDYSTFGDSTDATFKIEWRPVSDLLVRGSFADVFRVPTIYDLYAAPASNASQFNDPCVGLTQAQLDANPNYALACENVTPGAGFKQDNSQVDGLLLSSPELVPETGEVLTYGFVYDPSWLNGLSINVDFWDYSLEDVIIQLDVNTIADQCVATGDAELCGLISRFDDGQIFQIRQPARNFGSVDTSGIDIGVKYVMRDTSVGDFRFAVDATYIDKYDVVVLPGTDTIEVGGTFDRQFGNYAEWRGVASVGWALEPFTALVSARYIHSLDLTDPDGQPFVQPSLPIDSVTYLDLSVGYEFWEGFMARFSADNVTNEEPPLLYQNNVLNSNTDVSTYDVIGTYYRLSLSYKF